jgi:hypothetical protein
VAALSIKVMKKGYHKKYKCCKFSQKVQMLQILTKSTKSCEFSQESTKFANFHKSPQNLRIFTKVHKNKNIKLLFKQNTEADEEQTVDQDDPEYVLEQQSDNHYDSAESGDGESDDSSGADLVTAAVSKAKELAKLRKKRGKQHVPSHIKSKDKRVRKRKTKVRAKNASNLEREQGCSAEYRFAFRKLMELLLTVQFQDIVPLFFKFVDKAYCSVKLGRDSMGTDNSETASLKQIFLDAVADWDGIPHYSIYEIPQSERDTWTAFKPKLQSSIKKKRKKFQAKLRRKIWERESRITAKQHKDGLAFINQPHSLPALSIEDLFTMYTVDSSSNSSNSSQLDEDDQPEGYAHEDGDSDNYEVDHSHEQLDTISIAESDQASFHSEQTENQPEVESNSNKAIQTEQQKVTTSNTQTPEDPINSIALEMGENAPPMRIVESLNRTGDNETYAFVGDTTVTNPFELQKIFEIELDNNIYKGKMLLPSINITFPPANVEQNNRVFLISEQQLSSLKAKAEANLKQERDKLAAEALKLAQDKQELVKLKLAFKAQMDQAAKVEKKKGG